MHVLIIVPTYNERENLPILLDWILAHYDYRVLVVDDQSPDGTGAVADEYAGRHPDRIEVLHRTGPRGLGRSYVDGMKRALAGDHDVICQMDADFSHDPQVPARLDRCDRPVRSRDWIALPAGYFSRQLAASAGDSQLVCQLVRPDDHAAHRSRLHGGIPGLAPRSPRQHSD